MKNRPRLWTATQILYKTIDRSLTHQTAEGVQSSTSFFVARPTQVFAADSPLTTTTPKNPTLDWEVWRQLVDNGIKRLDPIRAYILYRRARSQTQRGSVDGDVVHARQTLADVNQERLRLHRQIARGRMNKTE
jgi:hypothetical protein